MVINRDEQKTMLADAKFSPSYDLSKIFTSKGELFHQLESIYTFYDYNNDCSKEIVNFETTTPFSIIKKPSESKESNNKPEHPCLLRLNTGKIAVFIPYCELIFL